MRRWLRPVTESIVNDVFRPIHLFQKHVFLGMARKLRSKVQPEPGLGILACSSVYRALLQAFLKCLYLTGRVENGTL